MLTFKLSRRGKTKQPTYRLVVVDKKKDPWGMIKEDVGSYNPHTKKAQFKIERIKYWISKGAQPSASAHNLLVKEKILEAPKKKIKIKKKSPSSAESADTKDKPATAETQNGSESQKDSEIQGLQENSEPQSLQEKSPAEAPTETKPTDEVTKTEEVKPEEQKKEEKTTPTP